MKDKVNILIIDDDEVDRMIVKRALKIPDLETKVIEVEDGDAGISLLQAGDFNCVFLDYLLPRTNGLKVLEEIRSKGIKTPVVVLTGHGDEQLVADLMKAGANDYLSKNKISSEGLIQCLSNVMHVQETELQLAKAERALRQSNFQMNAIINNMFDGLLTVNFEGKIESFNFAAQKMFDYLPEEVIGSDITKIINDFKLEEIKLVNALDKEMDYNGRQGKIGEFRGAKKDKTNFPVEVSLAPKYINNKLMGIIIVRDISERKEAEQMIKHLAYHDALTDLPNRLLLQDRFSVALANANRNNKNLFLIFIDLDRFKLVNDTLGHGIGDELLKEMANRIRRSVRKVDTVARMGGDEFTILLSEVNSTKDATIIAEKILNQIEQPYQIGNDLLYNTASMGIVIYPDDGNDVATLLKNADTAMYRAKENGGNKYQFFTKSMNDNIQHRMYMEKNLRTALKNNEFELFYQPQVDTETEEITGLEALIRWRHPRFGLIEPVDFISLAEECGLIVQIDEWVLLEACSQSKVWQETGFKPIRVVVNISAKQFKQPNFVKTVADVLTKTQLAPEWLELEITERATIQDMDVTVAILNELRKMGIHVSIDDFGTGYSSLNYLKNLPITTLKVDRSFMFDVTENAQDAAIVSTIIVLAQSLGLLVVAEGVENTKQFDFLKDKKCDRIQGFLFSKPLPADDLERIFLKKAYIND